MATAIVVACLLSCSAPTDSTSSGPAPSETGPRPSETGARIEFRPVVALDPCPSDREPADPLFRSHDPALCYTLGPVGFTGEALSGARASNDFQWAVEVTVEEGSRDVANELFNACADGRPTCPGPSPGMPGSVAIVLDGRVISAVAVNARNLADEPFLIQGTFTGAEAEDLARTLD